MVPDIQEIEEITAHLQELLDRLATVLTDKDKETVGRICELLNTPPPKEIDWDLLFRLVIQLLSFGAQLHN